MSKGNIAFLVGHSDWGKSRTLRELTDGVHQKRYVSIGKSMFYIRRMSNDDLFEDYKDFMNSLDPAVRPNVIAALCPVFDEPQNDTASLLRQLSKKGYELFFFCYCASVRD